MDFGDLSDRARYGIALVVIVAAAAALGEAIIALRYDDMLLFIVPLLFVIVAGIVWDRIYLHDMTF